MEHMMKQCKNCCRNITEEESKLYNGYCQKCYEDSNDNCENGVASKIKSIAILIGVIGIICAFFVIFSSNIILAVIIAVISIVIAIFIFGYGEIIQLLEDIKNK